MKPTKDSITLPDEVIPQHSIDEFDEKLHDCTQDLLAKYMMEFQNEIIKGVHLSSYPPGCLTVEFGEGGCILEILENIIEGGDNMLYIEWAEELERIASLLRNKAKGKPQYRSDSDERFIG